MKSNKINPISFRIDQIQGDPLLCGRLREIGLRKGMLVQKVGQAPFNGPVYLKFKNSFWALRLEEARCLVMSEVGLETLTQKPADVQS